MSGDKATNTLMYEIKELSRAGMQFNGNISPTGVRPWVQSQPFEVSLDYIMRAYLQKKKKKKLRRYLVCKSW